MEEKIVIETAVGKLKNLDWLSYGEDCTLVNDDETIAAAAKEWKMTPVAIRAIRGALDYLAESLIEAIEEDLKDIWEATH